MIWTASSTDLFFISTFCPPSEFAPHHNDMTALAKQWGCTHREGLFFPAEPPREAESDAGARQEFDLPARGDIEQHSIHPDFFFSFFFTHLGPPSRENCGGVFTYCNRPNTLPSRADAAWPEDRQCGRGRRHSSWLPAPRVWICIALGQDGVLADRWFEALFSARHICSHQHPPSHLSSCSYAHPAAGS